MTRIILLTLFGLLSAPTAQAHLIVAQRGSLNIVEDGAYLVLSLPVAAFAGSDDDGDGQLSGVELSSHAAAIGSRVRRGVQLFDDGRPLELEGLLLSPSAMDDTKLAPASQVVVMGRFPLPAGQRELALRIDLFGGQAAEQVLDVTITRKPQSQLIRFEPGREKQIVLPRASVVFSDYLRLGARHVLTGFDHLLFLLVVVAGARGLRQMVITLTSFTAGHALTLAASVLGGFQIAPAVVEPAIIMTIILLALYDWWSRDRVRRGDRLRVLMVFSCALVHGLGFGNALLALGLDARHLLLSLSGFSLGIEFVQLCLALPALVMLSALRRLRGRLLYSVAQRGRDAVQPACHSSPHASRQTLGNAKSEPLLHET